MTNYHEIPLTGMYGLWSITHCNFLNTTWDVGFLYVQ